MLSSAVTLFSTRGGCTTIPKYENYCLDELSWPLLWITNSLTLQLIDSATVATVNTGQFQITPVQSHLSKIVALVKVGASLFHMVFFLWKYKKKEMIENWSYVFQQFNNNCFRSDVNLIPGSPGWLWTCKRK